MIRVSISFFRLALCNLTSIINLAPPITIYLSQVALVPQGVSFTFYVSRSFLIRPPIDDFFKVRIIWRSLNPLRTFTVYDSGIVCEKTLVPFSFTSKWFSKKLAAGSSYYKLYLT